MKKMNREIKKAKIELEMKEEYEKQIKIPKPILIEIVQLCGLNNFLKISLISKQFYFAVKSDQLWLKMLKTTDLNEIEIDSMRKTQSLAEIYRDTLQGWDFEASNGDYEFTGKSFNKKRGHGVAIVVTKRQFVTGKENLVFEFISNFNSDFCGTGITLLDR